MPKVVPRTCNVCEAMCGMLVTVGDDGRLGDVRGDPDDAFSRGHICPKGPAMQEIQDDPDRLRHPVRRTANGWEKLSWADAFAECAKRFAEIRARGGNDALGAYVGNPTVHNHGASIVIQGLLRGLKSKNRFDANSMDANPRLFASMLMYCDSTAVPVPDVDRTDYFLMLGANPAASHGSLMSLGDPKGRLKAIRERGGKLVVVDPRRNETVAWASEHVFIRPGGDAAFLVGLIHTLLAEKLVDEAKVKQQCSNLERVRELVAPLPPERVAAASGIPADTIRRLARELAAAKRAVVYGRVGACTNEFGCETSWLIDVANALTGNLDREGGAMFTTPAVDLGKLARTFGLSRWKRWRSRVRGLPEFGGQLPVVAMAEEMDTPGVGQIRGFISIAGNPVLSAPNAARLDKALAGLDFYVAVDMYINETTRHANIILPPRYALERGHMDVVLQAFAVRNVVKWSEPVQPPSPDSKEDWEILYELGMSLGGLKFGIPLVDGVARKAFKAGLRLNPDVLIDLAIRIGPHGGLRGLTLAKVKARPHGIDLGALVPALKGKLHTPDKKVDLAPPALAEQMPRLARYVDQQKEGLVLIGRRHARTNNSWMHNCHSLVKGPDRAQLFMNPGDVTRLGLKDGQDVQVASRVGAVSASLSARDEMMPGVVSLPHGYGHQAVKDTMKIAGNLAGPNINTLTDETLFEPLIGTAILNGVPVSVTSAP
jgi:anaerobic selenocysteine-containing dehydrogenase